MRGFWLLRLLVVIQIFLECISFEVAANNEGDALITFKRQLNDPNGFLSSWDSNMINPCTWLHITCDGDDNVVRVDLGNMALSGSLVPELSQLASLQYLELFNNEISGSIPPELDSLSNIASLGLNHNALTGNIPSTLGRLRNLKFLHLDHNDLTGDIPNELTCIPTLLIVQLSHNNLSGVAPKFASNVVTHFEGNPNLIQ
ncbi:hypothetical protein R1flu_018154 [Riccia fluitans]|uniref:Leucine-rich repeat-containing N-terminal plant-type domain-containing protein n=1 Tax=Riccia fluitans TaxID=41844 RepID=A0ABD1ZEZ8_9MARC